MRVANIVRAAGASDPGLQRNQNEDRCHWDEQRGIYVVVDGVGGQAAGEKAADTALAKVRDRLERQTGRLEDRIREAIAIANDEIYRLASIRPEWKGMACVLTVAVVDNGDVVVGHVGDTRLYKIRNGRLQKITRDHSPVGEREDAGELSELEAMRHPRRNEVFRDVGSEPHDPDDPGFIDVARVPFERDAALLLCTDGLTDQVDSATIATVVDTFAGHPGDVVRELIEAANEAGGKDNVTAVYVEGEQFISNRPRPVADLDLPLARPAAEADRIEAQDISRPVVTARTSAPSDARHPARRAVTWLVVILLVAVGAAAILFETNTGARLLRRLPIPAATTGPRTALTVGPADSIAAALASAQPGTDIIVEPGEYREALTLASGVRLVSQVPRGATLRLSGTASDNEAVVTATRISDAQLIGFRIVGDAATPVGTGIYCDNSNVSIVDVEISGAKNAAVEFDRGSAGTLLGSDLINNFGSALVVRGGAAPRVSHNRFARNATAEAGPPWLILESGTSARFDGNIFEGLRTDAFPQLKEGNIFVAPVSAPAAQPPGSGRRGHR
jgi:serine/threonine protein phosphatase PrpC